MKKLFSLMLLLATTLTFIACSSDDEPEDFNLAGTEWIASAETGRGLWILEFVNETTVMCHCADDDGHITNYNSCSGTYSLNGSQITFRHVEFYWSSLYIWKFNTASIQKEKDRMIVSYTGGAGLDGIGSVVFEKR